MTINDAGDIIACIIAEKQSLHWDIVVNSVMKFMYEFPIHGLRFLYWRIFVFL